MIYLVQIIFLCIFFFICIAVLIWEIILMKTFKDTFSSSSTVCKGSVSKLSCSLG